MELERKVALITGGTKGIGAATAVSLAGHGAEIAIVGRHADEEAARTKAQVEARGRSCLLVTADLARPEEATRCVTEVADRLGSVDVLVHSAGGNVAGGLFEVSPETWHEAFNLHVHAVYYLCRAAIPWRQKKKEGVVILISSVAGLRGLPVNLAYQVVKGAIPQFTRALARQFADDNIRVNCVAPGIIRTRFHDQMTPAQQKHNLEHRVPLHHEGTPEQVADLITGLIANEYITGEIVTIDGGLTMRIA